ncbi:MAG TPA: cupredoxin domain-containing protein [Actinomycetota bacterium]|nr:cupredoxin domain-containing protein [Actinomycetota bacterium]
MSTPDDSLRPDLTTEVRFKVPLPLVIPLGALAVIAVVAIGFSKVLLAVPKEAATMLAIVAATNVLGAFAYAALRPRMQPVTMAELAIIVLYPVIIGVAIAQFDAFGGAGHHDTALAEEAGAGAGAEEGAPPEGPTTAIAAEGNAFGLTTMLFEAKKPVSLEFENNDPVQHNVAIYEDDSAAVSLFKGDIIEGGDSTTYEFDAPPKGEYYFRCDVHPDMDGTVVVE